MAMTNIDELRKKRFRFLRLCYEKSGGDRFTAFGLWEIGDELGFSRDESERIIDYLAGENLIEHQTIGEISLTHYGIREVEEALSHPERPTHYFPAVNIINIQHMEGSQIQQGTTKSSQTGTFSFGHINALPVFITTLKSSLKDLHLQVDDMAEVVADVETIESQLKSSRPKGTILHESLKSIRNILEGATGSVLATNLLNQLAVFFSK